MPTFLDYTIAPSANSDNVGTQLWKIVLETMGLGTLLWTLEAMALGS